MLPLGFCVFGEVLVDNMCESGGSAGSEGKVPGENIPVFVLVHSLLLGVLTEWRNEGRVEGPAIPVVVVTGVVVGI